MRTRLLHIGIYDIAGEPAEGVKSLPVYSWLSNLGEFCDTLCFTAFREGIPSKTEIGEKLILYTIPRRSTSHMNSNTLEILSYIPTEILVLAMSLFLVLKKRITLILASDSLVTGLPAVIVGALTRTSVTVYLAGDVVEVFSYKAETLKAPSSIKTIAMVLISQLCKIVLQRSDSVLAVNPKLVRIAKLSGAEKVVLCLNPIDHEMFRPSERIDKKRVKVVCVARLSAEKGIDYLLRAFKAIYANNDHVELVIVGDGPLRTLLENQTKELHIERNVQFLGRVKYSNMPKVYNDSDIFVLPSLSEGLSVALLEALSSGIPVVTTSVGDVDSIIENGRQALIVPPKDEKKLAAALESLITNSELRQRMGEEGRKLISAKFSLEVYYQELANSLLASTEDKANRK